MNELLHMVALKADKIGNTNLNWLTSIRIVELNQGRGMRSTTLLLLKVRQIMKKQVGLQAFSMILFRF